MSPERRLAVRHAMGHTLTAGRFALTVTRDILALLFGILFAVAGTHARLVDDAELNGWDVALCFLASCCIFGWEGLRLYRSRNGNGPRPSGEQPVYVGPSGG